MVNERLAVDQSHEEIATLKREMRQAFDNASQGSTQGFEDSVHYRLVK